MAAPNVSKLRDTTSSKVFGTAKELGKGFVPLQMISLGGRMLNVVAWREEAELHEFRILRTVFVQVCVFGAYHKTFQCCECRNVFE